MSRRLVVLVVVSFFAGFVLALAWLTVVEVFATRPEMRSPKLVTAVPR